MVTISVGLAVLQPCAMEDFEALFLQADQALYRAKAAGRNQVAGPIAEPGRGMEGDAS